MKLKAYNKENMSGHKLDEPYISLSRQGMISISEPAVEAIGLVLGDKISLLQDEDDPVNWYLMKDPDNGFVTRVYKGSKGLCFNAAKLAKTFLDELQYENTHRATFKIITEGQEVENFDTLYAVITTEPLKETVYADPGDEDDEK